MKTFVRYDGEDDNKQRLNVQALKSHAVQPCAVFSASLPVPPISLSLIMLNTANVASVVRCV
jgi:uncharacterized protein YbbK (DUF523 family)